MTSNEIETALDTKEETEASECNLLKEEDDIGSSSERECDSPSGEILSEPETIAKVKTQKEDCALLRSVDGELDYEEECAVTTEDGTVLSVQDSEEVEKELPKVNTPDKEVKDADKEVEDEGEIDDGEDLEEGELPQNADPSTSPKPSETTRQVCRFFSRGQCFFGNACRFLHLTSNFPSHNDKGQYHMFGMPPRYASGYGYAGNLMGPSNSMMPDRSYPPVDYASSVPPPREPSQVESAWERGLREAKELVKRANKRKEEEPDFDKKKLNLSIHVNEKNTPEYDKENDFYSRSYSKRDIHYKKSNVYDDYDDHPAREQHYENFEIRYTRDDMQRDRKARERSRGRECLSSERERYTPKDNRNKERYNDERERAFDIQMRTRAFEYVDPWRRSKTPKARQIHSRSGSYSSVSSYSCSDRSSRSYSYSRSSSRSSSCGSSRSPSVSHKRKASPSGGGADTRLSPKGRSTSRFQMKKKPASKPLANRSPSSSRSRSVSRTPSISRSRSYSRSISMDSVSSASSSLSHSSSASESRRNRNVPMSLLRKADEKLPLEKLDSRNLSSYDRSEPDRELKGTSVRGDVYPSEMAVDAPSNFPSFQHLLPGSEPKVKSQHKQQIKLTLLNKPATSKATSFPKKEIDRSKLLPDQKTDSSKADVLGYSSSVKRPLSPTLSAVGTKANPSTAKRSASSRRDELLKQLKAVEDAIARKRAKFC